MRLRLLGIGVLSIAASASAQQLEVRIQGEQRQPILCEGARQERILRLEARYQLEPPEPGTPDRFLWRRARGSGLLSLSWDDSSAACARLWRLERERFTDRELPLLLLAPEADPDTVYLYLHAPPTGDLGSVPVLRPRQGSVFPALPEVVDTYRGRDYRTHPATPSVYGLPLARRILERGPVWVELRDSIPESGARLRLRIGIGPEGSLDRPVLLLPEAPRFLPVGRALRLRPVADPPGGNFQVKATNTQQVEVLTLEDGVQIMAWGPGRVRLHFLYTAPDSSRAELEHELLLYRFGLSAPRPLPPLVLQAQYAGLPPGRLALPARIEPSTLREAIQAVSSSPQVARLHLEDTQLWIEALRPGSAALLLRLPDGSVLWQDTVRVLQAGLRSPVRSEPVISRPQGVTVSLQSADRLAWQMRPASESVSVFFSLGAETTLELPEPLAVFGHVDWPLQLSIEAELPHRVLDLDPLLERPQRQLEEILQTYRRYQSARRTGTVLDSLDRGLSVRALARRLWNEIRPVLLARMRLEGELVMFLHTPGSIQRDTLRLRLFSPEQSIPYTEPFSPPGAPKVRLDTLWTPPFLTTIPARRPIAWSLQGQARLLYEERLLTGSLRTPLPADLEQTILAQLSPTELARALAPYRERLSAALRDGVVRWELRSGLPRLEPAPGTRWLLLLGPGNP